MGSKSALAEDTIKAVIKSKIFLPKRLSVSTKSKYGDSIWTWEDQSNPRLRCHSRASLRIDWDYFWVMPSRK